MVITPIVNDGRINRSKTTLNKIVAATISLLRKNNNGQIPTAQEIAVKSGVGIRTVFRHIDDMEGLIEEVNRRYLHDLESYIAKNNPKQNSKHKYRGQKFSQKRAKGCHNIIRQHCRFIINIFNTR